MTETSHIYINMMYTIDTLWHLLLILKPILTVITTFYFAADG